MGIMDQRANLKGKTAAIIGGGGGIGAAISRALAEAGCDIAILDIDGDALDATAKAISATGATLVTQMGDATDPDILDGFYDVIGKELETLDVVVNVVGGVKRGAFMESDRATIADDIHRNYGYVIQSVQRAVSLIRRSGKGGSIINFTTIEAHRGAAGFSVYAGAKAATANFTRAMAVELGNESIRFNCIAPDTTPSQGNINAMPPEFGAAFAKLPRTAQGKGMEMYIPAKQAPPPDALANAVLFLASDLSKFVSGMTLHVDGGTMAAAGFMDWPFGDGFVPVPLAGTLSRMYRDGDPE